MCNRDLGTVSWCRLCDSVRPVGGGGGGGGERGVDFNNVILDFIEGHQWFDYSSAFAN